MITQDPDPWRAGSGRNCPTCKEHFSLKMRRTFLALLKFFFFFLPHMTFSIYLHFPLYQTQMKHHIRYVIYFLFPYCASLLTVEVLSHKKLSVAHSKQNKKWHVHTITNFTPSLPLILTSLSLFFLFFSFKCNRSCWYAEPPLSQSPHPSLCDCFPWRWISCESFQENDKNYELTR